MSLHRIHRRQIRGAALALGCCVALVAPSAASALDKIGDTPADFPNAAGTAAIKIGDTPADFPRSLVVSPVSAASKGDTPVDFPGARRAPEFQAPSTIQIVRPERTVVRNVDEALPIALSSAALLLAVGGLGIALVRTGTARRLVSRTH
jgi:hypothetical protein